MFRVFSTLAVVCAALLSISSRSASAQAPAPGVAHVIVELKGSPLASDTFLKDVSRATFGRMRLDTSTSAARWYSKALVSYQNREFAYLRSKGFDISVGYRMHVVFNGFTAVLPKSQVPALQRELNIVVVAPQRKLQPLLDRSVPLVNAPSAWDQLGGPASAGRGMMIAQMDSGIDITNPCFSDKGMPPPPFQPRSDTPANAKYVNNKVIVARAFGSGGPTKHYSAADTQGHGTFGAAIEACDYNTPTPVGTKISGVAPAAYLMNYNIMPGDDSGTGPYDTVIPALEAAVLDGADVVNMSFGFPTGQGLFRVDVDEQAVENAVRAGVPVVISSGNAGPTSQTVSTPAGAPDSIAVGASTNARGFFTAVDVGGPTAPPDSLAKIRAKQSSVPFTKDVGPAAVVAAGYGRVAGDDPKDTSANDFAGVDLQGKIALIERGAPTGSPIHFATKVANAASHGAIGAIIYDSNPSDSELIQPDTGKATLPTVFISNADGNALLAWVQAHPDATVTLSSTTTAQSTEPDILSQFSSGGPTGNYAIKPDLVGPGQDIYAAAQSSNPNGDVYSPDGFTTEEGTSMSAPHVTGATALLLQERPKATPALIKALLMETSNTSVYLDTSHAVPGVQQMGAGRLDVGAAFGAHAAVLPQSLSFGGVNDGSSAVRKSSTLTLSDIGGGAGTWQTAVRQLHGGAGVSVSVPASLTLASNGRAAAPVTLAVARGTAAGDYDGFVTFTHGSESLHVPYFVHVSSVAIKPHSALLVDDTTARYRPYQPDIHQPPVTHVAVAKFYTAALNSIRVPYTTWDEATQGSPTVQDMKKAAFVIFFTGANLNALGTQNADTEELDPPIGPVDEQALDDYLRQGGRVFMTGRGAALSAAIDPVWTALDLGAAASALSTFDTSANDPNGNGGVSPPKPSASPFVGAGAMSKVGAFSGLKAVDLSTKGDGKNTNLADFNPALQDLMGVPSLIPINGAIKGVGNTYGKAALLASAKYGRKKVAVVAAAEPTLKTPKPTYAGRSVLFSFGFEGINNNTGYATRAQILKRVVQWFQDRPTAGVKSRSFRAGVSSTLTAVLHAAGPARPGAYTWQIGSKTLGASATAPHYAFPHRGTYRVRVQVTDTLGHQAVSPWTNVSAR